MILSSFFSGLPFFDDLVLQLEGFWWFPPDPSPFGEELSSDGELCSAP
jgi:hypothetical protein